MSMEGLGRADLTGHGHPSRVGRKGLNDCALLHQSFKGLPKTIFFSKRTRISKSVQSLISCVF